MKLCQYVTVSPVTPKGKWLVCARRVGTADRLSVLCECRGEPSADLVVQALEALQGTIDRLQLPLQGRLDDARAAIKDQQERFDKLRIDIGKRDHDLREWQQKHSALERELRSTRLALDALQKKAVEQA